MSVNTTTPPAYLCAVMEATRNMLLDLEQHERLDPSVHGRVLSTRLLIDRAIEAARPNFSGG
jgi:hypothetical protein